MNIRHSEKNGKGVFYILENNEYLAQMVYHIDDTNMVVEHTEVSPVLKGQNVGKEMVALAVQHAREKNFKIIPECPFTRVTILRNKEYHDVLPENFS